MKHIVQLSGGKDSTAMLLMMLERGMPVDEIIFCDTRMEFPELYRHLEAVEAYIGRKITRLTAPHSFEYYLAEIPTKPKNKNNRGYGYGWPSMKNRWCTNRFKQRTTANYLNGITDYMLYIGIAADEPKRHKNIPSNVQHPLFDWGVTEKQALEYCYSKGFDFGGLYQKFNRLGCWCCPLQRISELRKVRHYYPELWARLLRIDKNVPNSFTSRRTAEQLERRFALEEMQGCLWKDDNNG